MILALIGQDGSGKSTISQLLSDHLKRNYKVVSIYLGSGEKYNSMIKKIYNRLNSTNPKSAFSQMVGMLYYTKIAFRCWFLSFYSKCLSNSGYLIIWDRCPQNQFIGINDGPKIRAKYSGCNNCFIQLITNIFIQLEESLISKSTHNFPDIVVKLHLSVEESMRRKPNNDINKIKNKHDIVNSLMFPHSVVIDIDATQPIDKEKSQILKAIYDFYK